MKTFIFLLFLGYLLFPDSSYCQKGFTYSESQPTYFQDLISGAVNSGETFQLLKRTKDKVFVIESYNKSNMDLVSKSIYNNSDSGMGALTPIDLVNLNGENYLVLSATNTSSKKQIVALQKIDSNGESTGEIQLAGSFDLNQATSELTFTIVVSDNHTCLAVLVPVNNPNSELYSMEAVVFNNKNKSLLFYRLNTHLISKWVKPGNIMVTNNGQLLIPLSESGNTNYRPGKLEEKSLTLYISQKENMSFKSIDILSADYEYSTLNYTLSPDQKYLEMWGMYAHIDNKYGGGESAGLFNKIINLDNSSVEKSTSKPFPRLLVALVNEKKESKVKADEGISNRFNLMHILFRDHKRWLVFEHIDTYKTNSYTTKFNSYMDYSHYNLGYVLMIETNNACDVEKQVFIPKKQRSIDDSGLYGSILVKEKYNDILLFFNDDKRNTSNTTIPMHKGKTMIDPVKAGLFKVTVHEDGSWDKELLKENMSDKNLIVPMSYLDAKDHTHYGIYTQNIFSEKTKNLNLGIFKLEY